MSDVTPIVISSKSLALVSRVLLARARTRDLREHLRGAGFRAAGGKLQVAATDGAMLALAEVRFEDNRSRADVCFSGALSPGLVSELIRVRRNRLTRNAVLSLAEGEASLEMHGGGPPSLARYPYLAGYPDWVAVLPRAPLVEAPLPCMAPRLLALAERILGQPASTYQWWPWDDGGAVWTAVEISAAGKGSLGRIAVGVMRMDVGRCKDDPRRLALRSRLDIANEMLRPWEETAGAAVKKGGE